MYTDLYWSNQAKSKQQSCDNCERYNLEQSIYRLFHALAQFLFTTSDTELDYYHQKKNIQAAQRLQT